VELDQHPGYSSDPLKENAANPLPGLLHKYYGRVLLTVAGICGVNCRFCFRRNFAYDENNPGRNGWEKVIGYIAADKTISEVILSGGDPLIASDKVLKELIIKIAAISHIKTLRIHTRMPIVIPMRITTTLIELLTMTHLRPVVVMHCNHPQEIDVYVAQSMQKLREANITLLNQAVLLKDINDQAEVLIELSEKLFSCGILPYYLHMLDRAQGTAQFAVAEFSAQQFMSELMRKLPGYLVPRLVREIAGACSKVPIPHLASCIN
jgi:EF-P beta-lysylation protein EpmB